jgi:DNA-binding IclR family transcriptional regulator
MANTRQKKNFASNGANRRSGGMGSVLKTFDVLEVFGREREPLTFAKLLSEVRQPKSSLHRILSTLIQAGVLDQDDRGRYRLTLKLWHIGVSAVDNIDFLQLVHPHLVTLSRGADETVHLAVFEPGGGIVYLAKVESPRSIRVQTQIGKVSPSWCTATGRALLAFDPEMREKVLAQPKQKFTPLTVTDTDELNRILDKVVEQGYAVTKGENHPEMSGIAAPIRDHTGRVVASCGVAIPAFRMDDKLVAHCTRLVLESVSKMSAELGYRDG